jgi:hypothetical protein
MAQLDHSQQLLHIVWVVVGNDESS